MKDAVLVTGGMGFIGSHVVRMLSSQGENVVVYDNLKQSEVNLLKKLRLQGVGEVKLELGDITDFANVFHVLKKHEVKRILHTAAITFIPTAIEKPSLTFNVNTVGTFNLLEASRILDIGKFIYISSASTYGDFQYTPAGEEHPLNAKDIYGATKAAADIIALSYYRTYKMPVSVIRTTSVYGPGDLENRVVKSYIESALQGKPIAMEGGGDQRRDFTYVKDAARGMLLALNSENAGGEAFNISGGQDYSIKELAAVIRQFIPGIEIVVTEGRKVDAKKGKLDTSKAKEMFGYQPEYDLRRGVEETIRWFVDVFCPMFGIKSLREVVL